MIFIRHSPPVPAMKGICYGQTNIEVQDSPQDAARKAAETLPTEFRPEVIHASDLERCASLASEIGDRFSGATLSLDPRLREVNFGDWENRAWSSIESEDAEQFSQWMSHWQTQPAPGGESATDLLERIGSWWSEIDPATPSLIIGHAGSYRMLRRTLDPGLSWDEAIALEVPFLRGIVLSDFL